LERRIESIPIALFRGAKDSAAEAARARLILNVLYATFGSEDLSPTGDGDLLDDDLNIRGSLR